MRRSGLRFRGGALAALLAAASLAAPSLAEEPVQALPLLADALVAGDMVQLKFWREPNLDGDYPVDEQLQVVLPVIGRRSVANHSAADFKQALAEEYARYIRNQEVQVTLLRRVRILGAVEKPGLYHVDPTMTVGDAVALAGGPTSDGTLKEIRLARDGRALDTSLDLTQPVAEHMRSGDQIVVGQRNWFVRYSEALVTTLIRSAATVARP